MSLYSHPTYPDSSSYTSSPTPLVSKELLQKIFPHKKLVLERIQKVISPRKHTLEKEYERTEDQYAMLTDSEAFLPPKEYFSSQILFQHQVQKLQDIKAQRSYPRAQEKGLLYIASQYRFKNFQFLKEKDEKVDVALLWDPMTRSMKGIIIFGAEIQKEYCTGTAMDEELCAEIAELASDFGIDCHFMSTCQVK